MEIKDNEKRRRSHLLFDSIYCRAVYLFQSHMVLLYFQSQDNNHRLFRRTRRRNTTRCWRSPPFRNYCFVHCNKLLIRHLLFYHNIVRTHRLPFVNNSDHVRPKPIPYPGSRRLSGAWSSAPPMSMPRPRQPQRWQRGRVMRVLSRGSQRPQPMGRPVQLAWLELSWCFQLFKGWAKSVNQMNQGLVGRQVCSFIIVWSILMGWTGVLMFPPAHWVVNDWDFSVPCANGPSIKDGRGRTAWNFDKANGRCCNTAAKAMELAESANVARLWFTGYHCGPAI